MPSNQSTNPQLRGAVSVSQMAKLVGLSRARFYDLVASGTFLPPIYSVRSRRPMYTADIQDANLAVRQSNIGVDGEYVVFYDTNTDRQSNRTPRRRSGSSPSGPAASLVRQLGGLGLRVTADQVEAALAAVYPNGVEAESDSDVLRAVYRHLRSQIHA